MSSVKILQSAVFAFFLVQVLGEVTVCPDPLTRNQCSQNDVEIDRGELVCLNGGGCDGVDLEISSPGDIFCDECKVKSIKSEGNINCLSLESCTRGQDEANPFLIADGNVNCFGDSSCRYVPLIKAGKDILCGDLWSCRDAAIIEAGGDIVCSGLYSCQGPNEIIAEGNVFCSAFGACSQVQITAHGDVTCTGSGACQSIQIEGCNVFCSGAASCTSSVINTIEGNDHSDGIYGSCGTVICGDNTFKTCNGAMIDTYTLQCLGDRACGAATISISNLKAEGKNPLQQLLEFDPNPIRCKGELCRIEFAGPVAANDDPVYTIILSGEQSLLFSCTACSRGVKFEIDGDDCSTHPTSSDCRNIECFPFDSDNECDPYVPGNCGMDGFECFYNVETSKSNTEDQRVSPYYYYNYDNYYGQQNSENHEGIVCDSFNGTKCVSPIDSNDFVFCREEKCNGFFINAGQILCIGDFDSPNKKGCSRSSLKSDNYVYCDTGDCNEASIDASRNVVCAGEDVCTDAARIQSKFGNFFAYDSDNPPVARNVGKILVEDNVYCGGVEACKNSFIEAKSNSVHCTAFETCFGANIETPRNLLCSSDSACNGGRMNSCNTFCASDAGGGCVESTIVSLLPRATSDHSVSRVYGPYPPEVRPSCEQPTIVCRERFGTAACNMATLVAENVLCLSSDDVPVEPTCVDSDISASNLIFQDLGTFNIPKLTCLETSLSCNFNFIGIVENTLMINLNPNQEIEFYCENCAHGVIFNFRTPCYESLCIPVTCKDSNGKCSPNECQGMIKCSGGGAERSNYVQPPIFPRRPKLRMCTNEDYLAGRTKMENKSGEKITVLGVTGWGELTKKADSKVN